MPGGSQGLRERTGREVSIFVYRDASVLLLRRSRDSIWHIPAGVVEAGESYEEAARRELEEETGLRAEQLIDLHYTYRYPTEPTKYVYPVGVAETTHESFDRGTRGVAAGH